MAAEALAGLKTCLTDMYKVAGAPQNMLAMYRHESEGLQCSVVVYLNAEFQRAAKLMNAASCKAPAQIDSGFLAGNKALMSESNDVKDT